MRELAQIIERLDEAGVLFRSATEPFDTSSPAGRMMGADARRLRRVRTRDDRRARHRRYGTQAARGEWAAGQVPYGYRRDGRLQFRVPEPAEVPLVRINFERYADRMEGAQSIARWLAERGYRTRRGAPFDPKAVLTILRNRVYVGEIAGSRNAERSTPRSPEPTWRLSATSAPSRTARCPSSAAVSGSTPSAASSPASKHAGKS
ncbi:DNA invertase Pin-like site-specific DNA recombinase [Conexibacter arvalis]|uniref:DNA invertase Pin-like site-specific DNA recombinase n=1 Tax=Conexibacter arvalis TaxID=912552 RepID=A0A840ILL1_9ACTN|nr:DNA invertase Pin-like site-specific DNA recombinase [Conexibacter arvalis]